MDLRLRDIKFSSIIFGLFFLIFTNIIYAQAQPNSAGQVIVSTGGFQDISANATQRNLQRGDFFYSGDTLVTGTNSSAQVRFTDGTVMALNSNTKVKVDEYSYQKSSSDRSVVSLVQGGFRALTGLISKANPANYLIKTQVAVIGVRGTNYGAVLSKGELYAGVWKGGIYVKNEHGLINLGESSNYNFAVVNSANTAPVGLLNPPQQLVGQCGTAQ